MTMLLSVIAIAAVVCLIGVVVVATRKIKQLKAFAAELENQLHSHSFELQIALEELAEKTQQLATQTQIDALSGIYNRAYFDKQMRAEIKRSRREHRELALVLMDIDHFKHINDSYGHLMGDKAIKQVASLIQQQLKRPGDKICRYGGEEFALILPNTTILGAQQLAEQIRIALSRQNELPLQLTISAGCFATVPRPESDADEYVGFADKALYRAKANGRNKVCSFPHNVVPKLEVTGEIHEH